MSWRDEVVVEQVAPGRFRAEIDGSWVALAGLNGGIVATAMVRAVESVLADDGVEPAPTLRAATLGYVSPTMPGEMDIDVEVVRRGRSMVTTHVRVGQAGSPTVVGRFHHGTFRDAVSFADGPAPVARPDDAVFVDWSAPIHISKVETYVDPATTVFGGAERAEWRAWSRPVDGGTFDASWLIMFGDYFPPAVFTRATGPSRAVTIEYSLQIHSAAASWTLGDGELLAARVQAFHSHDGFAVEDGWIHLPDGTLLATTRQTRLAG